MEVDEWSLKREYEAALIELQRRFEAVNSLSGGDPAEPLAFDRTREAYERARLVWLSCDLRLRSMGITGPVRFRQSKGILIYSATEHVRHSLSSFLKAHGYVSVAAATVNELHGATQTHRFAAVLVYIEAAMRRAPSFAKYLELASQPLPLIIFPRIPVNCIQPAAAAAADGMTPPLAALFSDLDRAIGLASSPKPASAAQGHLQLPDHTGAGS